VLLSTRGRRRAVRRNLRPTSVTRADLPARTTDDGAAGSVARRSAVNDEDETIETRRGPRARASTLSVAYSAVEVLRTKDFSLYSEDELAEAGRLIARLRLRAPMRVADDSKRPAIRVACARRAPHAPEALTSGGDRRVSCDGCAALESEGWSPPRRVRLHGSYARTMRDSRTRRSSRNEGSKPSPWAPVHACHSTLSWRDPDAALARASAAPDLEGGTRLGECLYQFNDRGPRRNRARRDRRVDLGRLDRATRRCSLRRWRDSRTWPTG